MGKRLTTLLIVSLAPLALQADPVSINPRPRMQAMGGAGVAAAGTIDSAMMNPAGLLDITENRIQAFPLTIEMPFDVGLVGSFLDYNDVRENPTGSTGTEKTNAKRAALEDFLSDLQSSSEAIRFNLYPSYTRRYMHFGLLLDMLAETKNRFGGVTSNQLTEFGGSSGTIGLILAGAYPIPHTDNRLQAGLTLKPIFKLGVAAQERQQVLDVLKGLNSGSDVGDEIFGPNPPERMAMGFGADVGLKYWIPFYEDLLKPAVGVTYQDIGDTRFFTDDPLPKDIPQSLSVGLAIHPTLGFTQNVITLDMRSINEQQEFLNYFHFGLESQLLRWLALRAGVAQGYFTGGVSFMTKYFEADIYVSAKEAGKKANIQAYRTLGTRLSLAF